MVRQGMVVRESDAADAARSRSRQRHQGRLVDPSRLRGSGKGDLNNHHGVVGHNATDVFFSAHAQQRTDHVGVAGGQRGLAHLPDGAVLVELGGQVAHRVGVGVSEYTLKVIGDAPTHVTRESEYRSRIGDMLLVIFIKEI